MPNDSTLIPVRLVRVMLREREKEQWIFLQEITESDTAGEPGLGRGFPIVIGSAEADEIHRVITGIETPRPMTHQLTASIVEGLGSAVVGVDIVDLRNNTFYARLRLRAPGAPPEAPEVEIDSRPSDALVLALRMGAPIRIAESVLEQVRTDKNVDKLPDPGGDELA